MASAAEIMFSLHGICFRYLSDVLDVDAEGLSAVARKAKAAGHITGNMQTKLEQLECAMKWTQHASTPKSNKFIRDLKAMVNECTDFQDLGSGTEWSSNDGTFTGGCDLAQQTVVVSDLPIPPPPPAPPALEETSAAMCSDISCPVSLVQVSNSVSDGMGNFYMGDGCDCAQQTDWSCADMVSVGTQTFKQHRWSDITSDSDIIAQPAAALPPTSSVVSKKGSYVSCDPTDFHFVLSQEDLQDRQQLAPEDLVQFGDLSLSRSTHTQSVDRLVAMKNLMSSVMEKHSLETKDKGMAIFFFWI